MIVIKYFMRLMYMADTINLMSTKKDVVDFLNITYPDITVRFPRITGVVSGITTPFTENTSVETLKKVVSYLIQNYDKPPSISDNTVSEVDEEEKQYIDLKICNIILHRLYKNENDQMEASQKEDESDYNNDFDKKPAAGGKSRKNKRKKARKTRKAKKTRKTRKTKKTKRRYKY